MSDTLQQSTDSRLISADKVSGVSVYDQNREKLGVIKDIYIDKSTGHAEYASMSFGGVLGVGAQYYPLPWATLSYDTDLDGFVVGLEKRTLENGPAYAEDRLADDDYGWREEVRDYYAGRPGMIAGGVHAPSVR